MPNNYAPVHVWYRTSERRWRRWPSCSLRRASISSDCVRCDLPRLAAAIDLLLEDYPGGLDLRFVTPNGVLIFAADLAAFRGRRTEAAGGVVER